MQHHPGHVLTRRRFVGQLAAGAAALALAPRGFAQPTSPAKKLGVLLVGLGYYSRTELAPALKLTEHCALAGVMTGSPTKGMQWARKYGFPGTNVYGYDDMPKLADNPEIDIVYVVTPNSMHAAQTIAAARAGKHVICEKPMAVSVAECDRMIAACRDARVKLSVGYRLHFDPYHKELMRLARERDFGPLTKMQGDFSFVMHGRPWRAIRRFSGGGPLMDIGIYVLHAACMAADGAAPIAVTAREWSKSRPDVFSDVEETISWTMEFPGGAVCEATASYTRSANQFRAEGVSGWINFTDSTFAYRDIVAETSRGPLHFDPPVNQQALHMDDFARSIVENREAPVPGELGRRDMAIIEAIYEAARTGARTPVTV